MPDEDRGAFERAQRRGIHDRHQEEGEIVIRTIAMPADTNPSGDIFGGWLMSQMDLAAGNLAGRVSLGRNATVAGDRILVSCMGAAPAPPAPLLEPGGVITAMAP